MTLAEYLTRIKYHCKSPIILFVLLLCSTTYPSAKTLHVTSYPTCDTTNKLFCSIQDAIDNAKQNDTIKLSAGIFAENLVIDKPITLSGESADKTTLDGKESGAVIKINLGAKVKIRHLTITNGRAKNGGGIFNQGSLMLEQVIVTKNTALQSGGGIYNGRSISGSLFVSHSEISHNQSIGDDKFNVRYGGGGIYNSSPLSLHKVTMNHNVAADNGGGIYSIFSGREKATENQKIAEEIGLAVIPKRKGTLHRKTDKGAVNIRASTISHNIAGAGGGINVHGVMTITQSSINYNKAINHLRSSGGGVFAHLDTSLILKNSTIAKNEAKFKGAGVRFYSSKKGELINTSIIFNSLTESFGQGAGLFVEKHTKNFSIRSSLIANNFIPNKKSSNCYGDITSLGNNFVAHLTNCNWIDHPSDLLGRKHHIKPEITWNKGFSNYSLSENSPVISHRDIENCLDNNNQPIRRDQTNSPRALNGCTIGAIEYFPL